MAVLSWVDYVVFGLVLAVSACIGLYYRFTGGKQSTLKEYILADRSMSPWPVAFSLMASFMSAVTLLGVTSENYNYGTHFMVINISYVLATPIICNVFLPVFYNRGGTSAYAYLEERFGKPTRTLASIAFSLQMILYNGIVLYAPSLALSAVTGLDKIGAVLSVGIVCTFYSTIGGMKAVLITDVFQSILMFAAVYIVIIHGIATMGFTEVFSRASEGGRIEFFNFDLDPTVRHTVWSQVFGGMFIYLSLYAVNQAQVQRLLTVKDLKTSQKSLYISLPILCFLSFSTAWAGLTIYARYSTCDPISQGRICSPDQLLPLYVIDNLQEYKGIPGLFIAGLLSGSLSTLSSSINSLAAVTLEDYIKPCLKTTLSVSKTSILTKCLALFFGGVAVAFSFVAEYLKGVLQASLTIFGVVGGPLLGLFTLGMVFPFVGQKSALPSFLISLVIGLIIGFGGPKPPILKLDMDTGSCDNSTVYTGCGAKKMATSSLVSGGEYFYLYRLSYMWYTLIGFTIVVVLGCIGGLLFPETRKLDESLFSPIIRKIRRAQAQQQEPEMVLIATEELQVPLNLNTGDNNVDIDNNIDSDSSPVKDEVAVIPDIGPALGQVG